MCVAAAAAAQAVQHARAAPCACMVQTRRIDGAKQICARPIARTRNTRFVAVHLHMHKPIHMR
eukprot:2733941-Pleurochrysis_carterae.AAC.1